MRVRWTSLVATCLFLFATDIALSQAELSLKRVDATESKPWLGGRIRLEVDGLQSAMKKSDFDVQSLRLFLDGHQLTDSRPLIFDLSKNLIDFRIVRTSGDSAVWTNLLGAPPLDGIRKIRISLGKSNGHQYPLLAGSSAQDINFRIFDEFILMICSMLLVVSIIVFVKIARETSILRNPSGERDVLGAYSLARCQMAFWLFIVTMSFLFIWIITGQYNGILTAQSLTLLGISATSAMVSVTISRNKIKESDEWPVHWTFFRDLLYDGSGPALHRYQMFFWTLILGAVFLRDVYQSFQLPQLDGTLLTMLGISNGLYLGFKWPEKTLTLKRRQELELGARYRISS